MKVGAVSLGWGNTPLQTIFEQLSDLGGECVEINGRPGRHAGLTLNNKTIPQVRQWAEAAGLEITGISGYCDFARMERQAIDEEIERLLASCRVASDMGVKIVRAFVGDLKAGYTFETFRPQIVDAFQQAAQEAKRLGVILAVENHGRLVNNGPALARLIEDIAASNLGVTLDTGNFCWAGHTLAQAEQDFKAVLPYVVNVHIKDGVWQDGEFKLVPAGQGELNIAALLTQLAERSYQGAIQNEYEGPADFLESTRHSIAYLKAARQQAEAMN
jgi:sugar phosphate isomerase/epimerase